MTTTTELTNIATLASEFPTLDKVKMELKRLQSVKCRLNKQKGRRTYEAEMTAILQQEQAMKEVRRLLDNSNKPVTMYTQDDIDLLDYDQTIKAIRSIQSKKSLTKWLNDREGDNDEYREACRIEDMLVYHRQTVKPVEDGVIRKTALIELIDRFEIVPNMDRQRMIDMLKELAEYPVD